MDIGRSKSKFQEMPETGVTFLDVAGADQAKLELQEVITFLKNPDKHTTLRAKIPKGCFSLARMGREKLSSRVPSPGSLGCPSSPASPLSSSSSSSVSVHPGSGTSSRRPRPRCRDLSSSMRLSVTARAKGTRPKSPITTLGAIPARGKTSKFAANFVTSFPVPLLLLSTSFAETCICVLWTIISMK
jgi:hypothetical protein